MKVVNLTEDSKIYTSNVYLILGEWNTLADKTTLVDVGSDPSLINKINSFNTGLGKRKIDQVILTHTHSDHSALLPTIKAAYNPIVYAFNAHLKGVDKILNDGDFINIGEQQFEVFHITVHSYDSICLFCEHTGDLFAGDTNFPIEFENQYLKEENAYPISRLAGKTIKTIYNGHGPKQDYSDRKFRIVK